MATSALKARWEETCSRLGVKPKQFGILIAVCAVAVGALGAKTFIKPRAAGAAVAKAPAAAPAPAALPAASASAGTPEAAPPGSTRTIQLTLETRPARDPFRPFFLVAAPAAAPGPAGASAATTTAAPAPKGLVLKAIVAGELAVINDETLGVGDEILDPDGKAFVVEEIQERRVVLREGGRRAELGYAANSKKRPQTPAGSLSPARK